MNAIRITLLADGSSDKALLEIVKWLLNDLYPYVAFEYNFADFRLLRNPPKKSDIEQQVIKAKELFPYDLLIYHRDAETNRVETVEKRKNEIFSKLTDDDRSKVVCVIPVKMMETWLLINEEAIKKAADNRHYSAPLNMPAIRNLEKEPAPKDKLHDLLKKASNLSGRRLQKFNVHQRIHFLAEYIDDYNVLRKLEAFTIFENDIKLAMNHLLKNDTVD